MVAELSRALYPSTGIDNSVVMIYLKFSSCDIITSVLSSIHLCNVRERRGIPKFYCKSTARGFTAAYSRVTHSRCRHLKDLLIHMLPGGYYSLDTDILYLSKDESELLRRVPSSLKHLDTLEDE